MLCWLLVGTPNGITELLAFSANRARRTLHLWPTAAMIVWIGDVRRINVPAMITRMVHGLIYDIMNDKQLQGFREFLETDFSFECPGVARFPRLTPQPEPWRPVGVFR